MLAVAGISIFSLGATFNYLVSLFRRRPVQQGLFGRPLFASPLDRQFGWLGVAAILGGTALGVGSLASGMAAGWDIARLWLWLLASAFLGLIGVQLFVSWVLMRVLEELSRQWASS